MLRSTISYPYFKGVLIEVYYWIVLLKKGRRKIREGIRSMRQVVVVFMVWVELIVIDFSIRSILVLLLEDLARYI